MKAYKVTRENRKSLMLSENSKFSETYSFRRLVDIGLVFTSIDIANGWCERYPGERIFEVECSHIEPCDYIAFTPLDKDIEAFHTVECPHFGTAPMNTAWGFDIRLVKEIKE